MSSLNKREQQRYARHFNLPNFGLVAQTKLKNARVLVVGAGGLGSPLLLYLAAAGVGHIGIIDPDIVSISNLQRQVLYDDEDIGHSKAELAAAKLKAMNPDIEVIYHSMRLDTHNALNIVKEYDVIADGTDNFPTRYLVNDACVLCGKISVYASIYQYEGQVAVFNYPLLNGERSPHYRDLFPEPPKDGLVPDCATGGVLGVLAGIIGSMQALEVIKIITGLGIPLYSKLLIYDSLSAQSKIIRLKNKSHTEVSTLINYEDFCGVSDTTKQNDIGMKEITVQELNQWREEEKDFQLIDVREQYELDMVNIGGDSIPLGDIMSRADEVAEDKDVVIMCRSGQRSAAALNALKSLGKENLYNLKGGILAWAKEINTDLPQY